ncbi:MAG: hypothetical protein M1819_006253 [Sarea resinae]|nr:MAG: hypothetical protein M1819_006253 [Sarea resinae]
MTSADCAPSPTTANGDMPNGTSVSSAPTENGFKKLHGRAFYESLGSPKMILAPMVDQSEFAWRMVSRSFLSPEENKNLIAYSPMLHARMFMEKEKFRSHHFQPTRAPLPCPPDAYHISQFPPTDIYLDGNPAVDRPLFVQFCANNPDELLQAAKYVQPFCDAVDLNLGCPQGIARRGHYGAFLQEDWPIIHSVISKLHTHLSVPVTAKLRILETKERTLDYARMVLSAGASIITVHGRQREQKGHNTGLADWTVIRYLRDNLPWDTVIFANGNILNHDDIAVCLQETGADAVMSAEGNLYDPSIFATPPAPGNEGREYWRGRDGKGGYRMDAVYRRYMDIIHRYVLESDPPERQPLFVPSDLATRPPTTLPSTNSPASPNNEVQEPAHKRHKPNPHSPPPATDTKSTNPPPTSPTSSNKTPPPPKRSKPKPVTNPNLLAMQPHLFHLLRSLVAQPRNHPIRDALGRCKAGDIPAFEHVLSMVEEAVRDGLLEYEREGVNETEARGNGASAETVRDERGRGKDECGQREGIAGAVENAAEEANGTGTAEEKAADAEAHARIEAIRVRQRIRRPWFIAQPYIRPLPSEALQKGSMTLSRKQKARLEKQKQEAGEAGGDAAVAATTTPTPTTETEAETQTCHQPKPKPTTEGSPKEQNQNQGKGQDQGTETQQIGAEQARDDVGTVRPAAVCG